MAESLLSGDEITVGTTTRCVFNSMDVKWQAARPPEMPRFETFTLEGYVSRGEPPVSRAMRAAGEIVGPFNFTHEDIASVRHHRHGKIQIRYRNAARLRFKAWHRAIAEETARQMATLFPPR